MVSGSEIWKSDCGKDFLYMLQEAGDDANGAGITSIEEEYDQYKRLLNAYNTYRVDQKIETHPALRADRNDLQRTQKGESAKKLKNNLEMIHKQLYGTTDCRRIYGSNEIPTASETIKGSSYYTMTLDGYADLLDREKEFDELHRTYEDHAAYLLSLQGQIEVLWNPKKARGTYIDEDELRKLIHLFCARTFNETQKYTVQELDDRIKKMPKDAGIPEIISVWTDFQDGMNELGKLSRYYTHKDQQREFENFEPYFFEHYPMYSIAATVSQPIETLTGFAKNLLGKRADLPEPGCPFRKGIPPYLLMPAVGYIGFLATNFTMDYFLTDEKSKYNMWSKKFDEYLKDLGKVADEMGKIHLEVTPQVSLMRRGPGYDLNDKGYDVDDMFDAIELGQYDAKELSWDSTKLEQSLALSCNNSPPTAQYTYVP